MVSYQEAIAPYHFDTKIRQAEKDLLSIYLEYSRVGPCLSIRTRHVTMNCRPSDDLPSNKGRAFVFGNFDFQPADSHDPESLARHTRRLADIIQRSTVAPVIKFRGRPSTK
jgi:hypothetical protein